MRAGMCRVHLLGAGTTTSELVLDTERIRLRLWLCFCRGAIAMLFSWGHCYEGPRWTVRKLQTTNRKSETRGPITTIFKTMFIGLLRMEKSVRTDKQTNRQTGRSRGEVVLSTPHPAANRNPHPGVPTSYR
jgi:hypothetical protein